MRRPLLVLLAVAAVAIVAVVIVAVVIVAVGGLRYRDGSSRDEGIPADPTPAPCPAGESCGAETVPGLAERKQAVLDAGGDVLDVAIAMLETRDMSTDYPYGDRKTDDSANFGLFKQNWYMLRGACREFQDRRVDQWRDGALLNQDLDADITCLNQSQDHYGLDRWYAGQRNGETGITDPETADIDRYRAAVLWIRDQLDADPAGLRNDTRYWVYVPAI